MGDGPKKKILIGEDDFAIARALRLKLEHEGYEVTAVVDGVEVMELVKKKPYDLLLLDLMMPRKDGFTVLRELKEEKIEIPVIILSNLGQEEDLEKAKELGAVDYFIKSNIQLSDIVETIKETFGS